MAFFIIQIKFGHNPPTKAAHGGSNQELKRQEVYETSYEPLRHLQGERLDLKIRGSAQAVAQLSERLIDLLMGWREWFPCSVLSHLYPFLGSFQKTAVHGKQLYNLIVERCFLMQVLVNGSARSTPNLPQPHYLALLHIARPATGEYNHFAYRFSAEPPFAILQAMHWAQL